MAVPIPTHNFGEIVPKNSTATTNFFQNPGPKSAVRGSILIDANALGREVRA